MVLGKTRKIALIPKFIPILGIRALDRKKKEQMQSTTPFFDIPILKKLLNYMLHHKVLYYDGLCS